MKRLGAILIVLVLAISAAAASVDISLAVGGQGTYGELGISEGGAKYDFTIDAELDMDFGKGQGMLVGMLLSQSECWLCVSDRHQL